MKDAKKPLNKNKAKNQMNLLTAGASDFSLCYKMTKRRIVI